MFLNSIFILKSIFVKKPRKWQQWSGHLIEIGNQGSLHTHYLCKSAIADPDDPHSMAPINPGSLPHPLRKPRITSFQSIVLYLRWSQSKDFASQEIMRLILLLGRWELSLFVIFLYLYLCLLWCFYLCLFFAFATRLKSHQPICVDVWPGAVWHPVSSVSVSRQRLSMSTKTVNQQSAASGGKNWFKDGSKYCHGTIYNNKRIAALSINQPE